MENSESIKITVEERAPKQARFPWTVNNINLLLDLYDKRIHLFLNKHHSQTILWKKLMAEMLQKIPEKDRDKLNLNKTKGKFQHLKKLFKAEFYAPEQKHVSHFYEKMNKMFTDYAMKRLNETDPFNETTDEQIQSMIMEILNDDPDVEVPSQTTTSVNMTLKTKITELPRDSVCIQKQKLRIDPNSPFNRQVSYNSIISQRESFRNSYAYQQTLSKRKLDDDPDFKTKTVKKVNSTPNVNDSQTVYVVEALDECELSKISMRLSKVIYKDQSSKGFPHASSQESAKSASHEVYDDHDYDDYEAPEKAPKIPNGSKLPTVVPKKFNFIPKASTQKLSTNSEISIKSSKSREGIFYIENVEEEKSVPEDLPANKKVPLEMVNPNVPPVSKSCNKKEQQKISIANILRKLQSKVTVQNETLKGSRSLIVPKKLNLSSSNISSNTSTTSHVHEDFSIAEIPPLNITSDYESDNFDVLRGRENSLTKVSIPNIQSKSLVGKSVTVPKNLLKDVNNLQTLVDKTLKSNPEVNSKQKETQPPAWFSKFLDKYEKDTKSINDKLDYLINTSQSSSALIHPRVTKIKRTL